MTALPLVLGTAQLPPAELSAARLDGELRELAEAYCSIDVHPSPGLRAAAMADLVPTGLIAEKRTAAWLLGAEPAFGLPVQLCVRSTHRVRVQPSPLHTVRQVRLDDDEIVEAGAVRLTSPARTAVDLLRWEPVYDRRAAGTLATLLLIGRIDADTCRELLGRTPHLPHRRRALERLDDTARLLSRRPRVQPPVTR